MKKLTNSVRAIAARAIKQVIYRHRSLNVVLPEYLSICLAKDKGLLQEFCYGTLRWYHFLAPITQLQLRKPLKPKDGDLLALILIGYYQLLFTRIPTHAAISETVNAAVVLNKQWAKGLINATLRNFIRQQDELTDKVNANIEHKFSHPQWLIQSIKLAWPDHWQTILTANNHKAPLTVRLNKSLCTPQEYLQLLDEKSIAFIECEYSPYAVQIEKPIAAESLPGFSDGLISIQDEAAQLAVGLMRLEPSLRILDACAAPGGKTCHLLEQSATFESVDNDSASIKLIAVEKDHSRLQQIKDNLQRLQLKAELFCGDACQPEQWWDHQPFDRILVDAPCSATGVIRRHPDIKLLRQEADIDKLAVQQKRILNALWPLLKPGGLLIYGTCSILPTENEQLVSAFLTEHKEAVHQPIKDSWGMERSYGRQLFPVINRHDGFYYACILKQIE